MAPLPHDGPYAVHFDSRIFRTLALTGSGRCFPRLERRRSFRRVWDRRFSGSSTVALAAFCHSRNHQERYAVLFFVSWFLITLAPMLPLPDHHSDYYLTIPADRSGDARRARYSSPGAWHKLGGPGDVARRCLLRADPAAAYLRVMIPDRPHRHPLVAGPQPGRSGAGARGPGGARKPIPEKPSFWTGSQPIFTTVRHRRIRHLLGWASTDAYLTPASRDTIHPATGLRQAFPSGFGSCQPAKMRSPTTSCGILRMSAITSVTSRRPGNGRLRTSFLDADIRASTSSSRGWQSPVGLPAGSRMVFAGIRDSLDAAAGYGSARRARVRDGQAAPRR